MRGVLDNKVAVITGGGTGIGEAIAKRFAEEGCKVVVAGRRHKPIARVAEEIGGLAVVTNVATEEEVKTLFKNCEKVYGRLDVLVNNAGISGPRSSVKDMNMAEWDETVDVNMRGVLLCIKYALPLMEQQGGAIINISSRTGLYGKPNRSAYGSTKLAVLGITESVAHEVGASGIRVNTICPGGVVGERFSSSMAKRERMEGRQAAQIVEREYITTAALGRLVDAREIASTALFLASDNSSAITGQYLVVDAGRRR